MDDWMDALRDGLSLAADVTSGVADRIMRVAAWLLDTCGEARDWLEQHL